MPPLTPTPIPAHPRRLTLTTAFSRMVPTPHPLLFIFPAGQLLSRAPWISARTSYIVLTTSSCNYLMIPCLPSRFMRLLRAAAVSEGPGRLYMCHEYLLLGKEITIKNFLYLWIIAKIWVSVHNIPSNFYLYVYVYVCTYFFSHSFSLCSAYWWQVTG